MTEFKRIMVINTGWSDDYSTRDPVGNFANLDRATGHEKFNFRRGRDGLYYGYVPPRRESPPKPKEPSGWLVFAVSKRKNEAGMVLVGWYENARFLGEYRERPDADDLGPDSNGNPFYYTFVANRATMIPLPMRQWKVDGKYIGRPFNYLRGNGESTPQTEAMARQLLQFREECLKTIITGAKKPELDLTPSDMDSRRRREIELKAEDAVKLHFSDWNCERVADEKCGYDLKFTHPVSGQELHVEVKGTAADYPQFFITHKEYRYAEEKSVNDDRIKQSKSILPRWRLAVVHDVYGDSTVSVYTFDEMKKVFEILPYAYRGTLRNA